MLIFCMSYNIFSVAKRMWISWSMNNFVWNHHIWKRLLIEQKRCAEPMDFFRFTFLLVFIFYVCEAHETNKKKLMMNKVSIIYRKWRLEIPIKMIGEHKWGTEIRPNSFQLNLYWWWISRVMVMFGHWIEMALIDYVQSEVKPMINGQVKISYLLST